MELYNEFEPAFGLIGKAYNLFDKWQTKKHVDVVTSFHRNILDGEETEERINYEKENIQVNQDDYFTLLKFAIADDEEQKTDIYSNIYKYIRDHQNIEKREKNRIIRITKALPFSAIELLPEIYVYNKFDNLDKDIKLYLSTLANNFNFAFEINLFIQYGLFVEESIVGQDKRIQITELLNKMTEIFFKKNELTPEFLDISKKEKRGKIILTYDLEDNKNINKLKSIFFQSKLDVISEVNFETNLNGIIQNIAFLFTKKPLSNQTINILKKNLRRNNKIIKVTFDKDAIDPIPEIGNELIFLNNKSCIDAFIDSIVIE
ncbi:hypothetical protein LPB137_06180 [Poseidonibacter parvus]|uniref:Uncharacterized protein n=1 Tax=Poseidonibacter parvus TaxID=1850254 RepID=A0A1P8KLN4_9BACT|nr:hypothetical protein [Poseidonibacter parvus]APW65461.1 hypothetical protein LPB137_06180 [Poseidonibacter parvus]